MTDGIETFVLSPQPRMGILTREFRVQVVNCSASGCLVETQVPVAIGTTASLRLRINGDEFLDDVHVVRCQRIAGAGSIYHVGAQFLWTTPPTSHALRLALQNPEAAFSGATLKSLVM